MFLITVIAIEVAKWSGFASLLAAPLAIFWALFGTLLTGFQAAGASKSARARDDFAWFLG
jgi:hypothetical protein